MLNVYAEFAEKYMAVPVVKGVKSANERFAGALDTYTIEAMMQDGKALQSGTSHFLGQNFAKAFDVQFVNKNNEMEYVWATSWGVSTRLMGALIMTHSDDNGLVLPPHLAPIQVVIVPIYKNDEQLKQIDAKVEGIVAKLKALGISVKYDNADNKRPGFKFADYELKGVPVRLVMGGRDLENNTMEVMRRDTLEKETVTCEGIEMYVQNLLEEMQANIYKKALDYRNSKITTVDTYDEFKEKIEEGGFILMKGSKRTQGYEIKVVDNGRGIPQEEIARITEAFYMVDKSRSRKEGGAGIGMALCQKIITLHQGELKIDSKLGEGTVMRLYFPGEMQVVKNKSNRGAKGGR